MPIQPATPDVTSQVSQILDFNPDVIIFSAQSADCWNLVDGLTRLGWTPDRDPPRHVGGLHRHATPPRRPARTPIGIYFIGTGAPATTDPSNIDNPVWSVEATAYFEKSIEYGLSEEDRGKGFATNGVEQHDADVGHRQRDVPGDR